METRTIGHRSQRAGVAIDTIRFQQGKQKFAELQRVRSGLKKLVAARSGSWGSAGCAIVAALSREQRPVRDAG